MATLDVVATELAGLGRRLDAGTERFVRVLVLAIDRNLVLGSAVDTGRFRSNWMVRIGGPWRRVIAPYAPLPRGKDPSKFGERANAAAAMASASARIAPYKGRKQVWISNNVVYAYRLTHESHSLQMPGGRNWLLPRVTAGVLEARRAAGDVLKLGP